MTTVSDTPAELPDFDLMANILVEEGVYAVNPSELHGLLCGHLSAGARMDENTWLRSAAELLDLEGFNDEQTKLAMLTLYQQSLLQLEAPDLSFELLLPDDETPVGQRAACLGSWCTGFMAGFGLHSGKAKLSAEAEEVLTDLSQIAQIADDAEDTEENESDMLQLQEYVRMAGMMLFTERNTESEKPADKSPKTLH